MKNKMRVDIKKVRGEKEKRNSFFKFYQNLTFNSAKTNLSFCFCRWKAIYMH